MLTEANVPVEMINEKYPGLRERLFNGEQKVRVCGCSVHLLHAV